MPTRTQRIDQLVVQEALRVATRRCAIWGRDSAARRLGFRDDEFVRDLVKLVRRYERTSPTGESPVRDTDQDLRTRIRSVLADFTKVMWRRKRKFGRVPLNRSVFHELSEKLRLNGFDLSWQQVKRAVEAKLRRVRDVEDFRDLLAFRRGEDGAARFCLGALNLDAGAGERLLHKRKAEAKPTANSEREVSTEELVRYFLACLSIGPNSSAVVASVVMAAYENSELSPELPPLRDLKHRFVFLELGRPRPAYGPAPQAKTGADRRRVRTRIRPPGRKIQLFE